MLLAAPVPAFAQDAEPSAADAAPAPPPAAQEQAIDFSAATVSYDSESELITASGAVRMARDGNYLAADKVVWDRRTGEVRAEGNVVVLNPAGDKLVGERVVLTDSLRDGTIENLLVVLESGGRIAATHGTRQGDVTTLDNAIYSPCPVTSASGCPRRPSWSITAARVIYDPTRNQVRFRGGRLQLFGIDLPLLPVFAIGTGGGKSGANGWLIPDINVSSRNGFEIAAPYYRRLAPNRDLTVTPHLYSATYPAIEARYRELNRLGAFQLGGFATYGSISDSDFEDDSPDDRHGFRLYLDGNGKAQLNPLWSVTGAFRVASDKTLTRRFDITRDDRLRSFVNAERIDSHSYISIAGWAFQGLRVDDVQKQFPIALPAIDARWRMAGPVVGGDIELQANSLAILRIDGQDTQRAFTSARWDLRRLTPWGQQLLFTALVRGDLYHTQDSDQTNVAIYRGTDGWHARGIAALAADAQWPLIGPLFGGIQRLVPRAQLLLTPPTPNLNIPNEDARAVDLEDSNLFALNRFPGYDRWEDGSRLTLGVDWFFDRPNLSIATTIGQSFRISKRAGIFPEGTGLTDRVSDIVGRSRVRYGR
ncbi:MAG: LPS assembly protein LptD, partial [Sphingomicrobium sp.]